MKAWKLHQGLSAATGCSTPGQLEKTKDIGSLQRKAPALVSSWRDLDMENKLATSSSAHCANDVAFTSKAVKMARRKAHHAG